MCSSDLQVVLEVGGEILEGPDSNSWHVSCPGKAENIDKKPQESTLFLCGMLRNPHPVPEYIICRVGASDLPHISRNVSHARGILNLNAGRLLPWSACIRWWAWRELL